jgi:hypothetical protein
MHAPYTSPPPKARRPRTQREKGQRPAPRTGRPPATAGAGAGARRGALPAAPRHPAPARRATPAPPPRLPPPPPSSAGGGALGTPRARVVTPTLAKRCSLLPPGTLLPPEPCKDSTRNHSSSRGRQASLPSSTNTTITMTSGARVPSLHQQQQQATASAVPIPHTPPLDPAPLDPALLTNPRQLFQAFHAAFGESGELLLIGCGRLCSLPCRLGQAASGQRGAGPLRAGCVFGQPLFVPLSLFSCSLCVNGQGRGDKCHL